MSRPADIPADVWNAALDIEIDADFSLDGQRHGAREEQDAREAIARAILNERELCAQRAEGFETRFRQTRDWVPGSFYAKLRREVADIIRKGDS